MIISEKQINDLIKISRFCSDLIKQIIDYKQELITHWMPLPEKPKEVR